jgi:proline iminopeptidase
MKNILKITFIIFISLFIWSCSDNNNQQENNSLSEQDTLQSENIKDIPPFTQGTVKTNKVELGYKIMGEGEPMVILHAGPGLWSDYLIPYLKPLSKRYKLIFLDQRGNGTSSFPTDSSFTFDDYVNDIHVVLNELNIDQPVILGHSFGGLLAALYASAHPDKVQKLILVTPAPANSIYFEKTFNNRERKRNEADTKKLIKLMSSKEFVSGDTTVFKKALIIADKINVADTNKIKEIFNHLKFTPQQAKNLLVIESIVEKNFWNMDVAEKLHGIKAPTLIIHGSVDNIPLESDQIYMDNIENAKIVVIKDAGHYPFAEQPVDFMFQLTNFLDNH